MSIQGDPGGKVIILGSGSMGHCEEKSSYRHVSSSEYLPTYSCLNLQIQKRCDWQQRKGNSFLLILSSFKFTI